MESTCSLMFASFSAPSLTASCWYPSCFCISWILLRFAALLSMAASCWASPLAACMRMSWDLDPKLKNSLVGNQNMKHFDFHLWRSVEQRSHNYSHSQQLCQTAVASIQQISFLQLVDTHSTFLILFNLKQRNIFQDKKFFVYKYRESVSLRTEWRIEFEFLVAVKCSLNNSMIIIHIIPYKQVVRYFILKRIFRLNSQKFSDIGNYGENSLIC